MTKSIPNYVCIKCGRGFTRRSSGIRHINTVESGYGYIVTEADYRAGALGGIIPPPMTKKPQSLTKNRPLSFSAFNMHDEAFLQGYFERLGKIVCDKMESEGKIDHTLYRSIITRYILEATKRATMLSESL